MKDPNNTRYSNSNVYKSFIKIKKRKKKKRKRGLCN